jgi:hypothetical protein
MSVSPALMFPPSTETQVEAEGERPQQAPSIPGSGGTPSREIGGTQDSPSPTYGPEDEVKMQFQQPGEIAVYQFINQRGTLILQVPPQPVLNLARAISQELAQEAAPKPQAAAEGGKNNGR